MGVDTGLYRHEKGRSFWGYYFLSFLISPLITIIVILCLSNLNKTETIESTYANVDSIDISEADMVKFCRKCGNTLLERAKFCNKCGTEVIEDIPLIEENDKHSEQGDYL